ncbi:hypothetical protein K2X05_04385, partial [bacterium]|nr:hypothetical protein [bacterium]
MGIARRFILLMTIFGITVTSNAESKSKSCHQLFVSSKSKIKSQDSAIEPIINGLLEKLDPQRPLGYLGRVANIQRFIQNRYSSFIAINQRIEGRLYALGGDNFITLAADPGLMMRLSEFEEFIANNPNLKTMDPWEVRKIFSNHLGTKKFFRALALTPEENQIVLEQGMDSYFTRSMRKMSAEERSEKTRAVFSAPLFEQILARVR